MKIDRQEIHSTVLNLLELLENEANKIPVDVETLQLALDRLALVSHFVDTIPDDKEEYSGEPVRDYTQWKVLAETRFPGLGYYNIPSKISVTLGEAEIRMGDAIDDVADIANELSEFVWRWHNNSENDALWHFRFSYESHWGSHLRSLQTYLHALRTGQ